MFAAMLATALALLALGLGRKAHRLELETGQTPAAYYWLCALIFPFGGAILYYREDYPFLDSLASDLTGMLLAGSIIYYGYETARPLVQALTQRR